GAYPFFGKLVTEPANAESEFRRLASLPEGEMLPPVALVEKTLMLQFALEVGDTIRVGNVFFEIIGQLNSAPGRSGIAGSLAPVVYIPKAYIQQTDLIQPGSLVEYQYHFEFLEGTNVEDDAKTI